MGEGGWVGGWVGLWAWGWGEGSASAGHEWLTVTPIKASSSRTPSAAPKSPLARSVARSDTMISTSDASISSSVSPGSRMYGSFGFGLRLVRIYGTSGRLPPESKPPRGAAEAGLSPLGAPQRKQAGFRAKTLAPQSPQVQSPGFAQSSKRMAAGVVRVTVRGRRGVVDTRMARSIPLAQLERRRAAQLRAREHSASSEWEREEIERTKCRHVSSIHQ